MKKIILAFTILLYTGISLSQEVDKALQEKINKVETGLNEFKFGSPDNLQNQKTFTLPERMTFYKVPGVSIAVINDNKIEWAKGYGMLNANTEVPVTVESYFEAASTTKMLVAAVILHYVGKGILDLDMDVNKYLKSWKIPENEFTREKKVTLRLLLTHQSGLPSTNFPYEDGKTPSLAQVLKGELPAQNKPAIVEILPGSKWQYSNIGYVVIQLLLEDITGKKLHQVIKEIIFEPLGMNFSTLVYPMEIEKQKNEALPHNKNGKVCESSMHPTAFAQGGLITTPSDLALFTIEMIRAYKGESDIILTKEMVLKMFHSELDLDPAIFGVPLKEGLGVFLQNTEQVFAFGHPGENFPGATCWQMGVPDVGKGVIIMTNGANGFPLAMEIYGAIKKEYSWPAGL
jgi:CubicO group peptidase (beta-lactamase class C family)